MPVLHLHGHYDNHSPSLIEGNRDALELLRDAINVALGATVGQATVFVNDGEGYDVVVLKREDMERATLPYQAEWHSNAPINDISGWDLVQYEDRKWVEKC